MLLQCPGGFLPLFTALVALMSVFLPVRAATSEPAAILRVLVLTAPRSGSARFQPGPAIAESDINNEEAFVQIIRQRNPGWTIEPLGKLTAQPKASMESPDLDASIRLFEARDDKTNRGIEKVQWGVAIPHASPHYAGLRGMGSTSEEKVGGMAYNQAYLKEVSGEKGSPQHVAVFVTYLSQ